MDQLSAVAARVPAPEAPEPPIDARRLRVLQTLGIVCGLTAGAWLGAAEAPTKLVTAGISPVVISLVMVVGVFLARWTLPTLIHGTSYVAADLKQAPHLIVWAILAGCMWAVANTLTIFAVRDVGLSVAFPLWNSNSLLGILWGVIFFAELRDAGARRWAGVIGGALLMFAGAVVLTLATSHGGAGTNATRGIAAALAAGALWGTMYIPYRKAYLTGMNPLSFITFFTVGELVMMGTLAVVYSGGVAPLWGELSSARHLLFWLMAGGVVWVVGDLFQQYAVKYAGITRGIPLSNSNQLWGLLWGILVFGELRDAPGGVLTKVVLGSLIMAAGTAVIAFSSARESEHRRWREAAARESARYGIDPEYTSARGAGRETASVVTRRTALDWVIVVAATAILVGFATIAERPSIAIHGAWAVALVAATLGVLAACGVALWRTTRFS